jgi:hypothetical protein
MNTLIPFASLDTFDQHFNDCIDLNIPLFLIEGPGVGKSSFTKFKSIQRDANYYKFVPAFKQPSDIGGIKVPVVEKQILEYFYQEFSQILFEAEKETIIHIEDLLLAPPMVANVIMSIIEAREINGKPISEHIRFVIDSNDMSHKSGSGQINAALNNRGSICQFPIDVKGWIKNFALPNGVAKEIILFLHANPDFFATKDVPRGYTPFATPRSWTKLSEFVKRGRNDMAVVSSFVGSEAAGRFCPFVDDLAKYGNLIAKVKHDPDSAPMFDRVDEIIGAVFMLSNHFEKANVDNFVSYINRYQQGEYKSLLIDLGVQTHPDSKETKVYVEHITQKGGK